MLINRKIAPTLQASALSSLLMVAIPSVQAHEPRMGVSDALNLTVGLQTEPAFEDEPNALDLIVNDLSGNPLEITDIELDVDVMLLSDDAVDARVLASSPLLGELRQNHAQPNRYNISFMPTMRGAYGFHISGSINGIPVDERFICGGGTQNSEGKSFGCVNRIQRFPGWPGNAWKGRDDH